MPSFTKPDFSYRPELQRLLRRKAFSEQKGPASSRRAMTNGRSQRRRHGAKSIELPNQ